MEVLVCTIVLSVVPCLVYIQDNSQYTSSDFVTFLNVSQISWGNFLGTAAAIWKADCSVHCSQYNKLYLWFKVTLMCAVLSSLKLTYYVITQQKNLIKTVYIFNWFLCLLCHMLVNDSACLIPISLLCLLIVLLFANVFKMCL
jgi:hypothetical protein